MAKRNRQAGSAILEIALCGIPLIFAWISTVQMSLGMWHYHTLQYATKAAGAYMSTHGANYVSAGNTAPQIKDIATVLANQALGIPASGVTVLFTAYKSDGVTSTTHSCTLSSCQTDSTTWPPTTGGYNSVGNAVEIKTEYLWQNSIAMVAPGHGSVNFSAFWLPGFTHQVILF